MFNLGEIASSFDKLPLQLSAEREALTSKEVRKRKKRKYVMEMLELRS